MRAKGYLAKAYFLTQNPFPETAIVNWGSGDERNNGSLFSEDVYRDRYEEAVTKFIVNPVDSGSKFHFLWSLGDAVEARGFGKTALLSYLARMIIRDLGQNLLRQHDFDEEEAKNTPILAAMATFDTTRVTTLAGISLEHVKFLLKNDESGEPPLNRVRKRLFHVLCQKTGLDPNTIATSGPQLVSSMTDHIKETDLSVGGKTIGAVDKKWVQYFAIGDLKQLLQYTNEASDRKGYELLHTVFVIARSAGIRRVFLLIDQVEDFANADVPKKRRHMEVERFRDLAIETQPFGEMASYVLTMHPEAARSIEEFWSLARLPKIDHMSKQNERVTVVLRPLDDREEASNLLLPYLTRFRKGVPPHSLFPFSLDAVEAIRKLAGGRPGKILEKAYHLIETGAASQWAEIGEQEVISFFKEEQEVAAPDVGVYRRKIGRIDF